MNGYPIGPEPKEVREMEKNDEIVSLRAQSEEKEREIERLTQELEVRRQQVAELQESNRDFIRMTDEAMQAERAKKLEIKSEREAREKTERERDLIAKTYADVTHCTRCPARNREMHGFNQCGKPCAESILEWVKAQEVPNVQS